MRKKAITTLLAGLLLVGSAACKNLDSPNFNSGDLEDLRTSPTPSSLATAIQGLMLGARSYIHAPNEYVVLTGILGRNAYNMDPADPRFSTEMLAGDLNAGSPAFGGNVWDEPYANIRLADEVLQAIDAIEGIPEGQKEAARGFAKTIQALDFLHVVNTRDDVCGCPIEVPEGVQDPAPQVGKEAVFDHIEQLLQEARGHLQAGTSFPFELSSGFAGFDTPATFLEFNWALQARVDVYRMQFQDALNALQSSFLDPAASFGLGVYHAFGTGSGDQTNGIQARATGDDPNIRPHPSVETDAELKANGDPDDRFTSKTRPVTFRDFGARVAGSDIGWNIYQNLADPIPIIRNEELILLRAEANIGLGNLEQAEDDLNLVRTQAGGLEPVELTSQAQALDRLLYEKRYSLLFEQGQRWLDLRRYGLEDRLELDLPGHQRNLAFPIPQDEQLARGGGAQ